MTHHDSSAASPRLTSRGAAGAVARRPHEGAGPCIPFGGRRPGRAARRGRLVRCGPAGGRCRLSRSARRLRRLGRRRLLGTDRLAEAQRLLVAPGAPIQQWHGADIGGARFMRVVPDSTSADPPEGATVEFAADVWIEPAGAVSPWGDAGVHRLFESVVRMSDGTWRMWQSGAGP